MGPRNPKINWFLTYPRVTTGVTKEMLLEELNELTDPPTEYLIAEEHHEDGGLHLHAFVKFPKGILPKNAPKTFDLLDKTGNYQPCRSAKAVIKYCEKEGSYISNFDVGKYKDKKLRVTPQVLRENTALQALDNGLISFQSMKQYEFARSHAIIPRERDDVCGLWLYGPPGTGKSRYARYLSGDDVYMKAQNKWFDGYGGQTYIILDDLDKEFKSWHNLKIWTDRYKSYGEVKGGQVSLSHRTFIVTSNYHPSDLVKDDPCLLEAVLRRFRFQEFKASTYALLTLEPHSPPKENSPPKKRHRRNDSFEEYCITGKIN